MKTYTYEWVRSLQQNPTNHIVSLFPLVPRLGILDHEGSVLGDLATRSRLLLFGLCNINHSPLLNWLLWRTDVFHASPHVSRLPSRTKLTATLYDMSCWILPETHTSANVKATQEYGENVLGVADGVIAISQSSLQDAIRLLGLREDRAAVIYPGVADRYFQPISPQEYASVKARYGLTQDYCLFVGTIEPRKNVDRLLNAYAALPASSREQYDLVVIGSEGWNSQKTVARLRSVSNGIRYLGYVPESDLPALTAGASLFVYPSLYEGFGLPLAQAMAAGVPSITSNVSSLPEVAGDAATLIDPRSTSLLTAAIQDLLTSPSKRQALANRARERAQKFRWNTTAKQSWQFFERISGW